MTEERFDTVITNGRFVNHDSIIDGTLGVRGGRIAFVSTSRDAPPADEVIDARGRYVIPGLIDPHTHPGALRPFSDDIRSETRAAAAGGVTSWFATIKSTRMGYTYQPVTEPHEAISYLEACKAGIEIVEKESTIDVGFNLAIQCDRDAEEIPAIARQHGVTTYKFYVGYRGANDFAKRIGLPLAWDDGTLFIGFENIARIGGLAMIHAENNDVTRVLTARIRGPHRQDLAAWEDRSPDFAEAFHISTYSHFALVTGATLYIVHTSSGMGLRESAYWRARGAKVVNETVPHYFMLTKFDDPPGKMAKVNTPIRTKSDNEALWAGIRDGEIECIGSDHVPGTRAEQADRDLWDLMTGMAETEQILPLMLTEGVNAGRISIQKLVEVCSYRTAVRFGVYPKKGVLQPGSDADLVIVDLDRDERISIRNPKLWHSDADFSIWEGRRVTGLPVLTMIRGRTVMRDGEIGASGGGQYLRRTPADLPVATDGVYPRKL
jgi:dihydroorotase-like cyclic amidohydrolase